MPVPMIEMMEHVPLWLVGLIVMIVAEVYGVGLMLSTRAIYGVSRLAENNEVAGFKFAVVGVFYAVLRAFVVIAVWEEYRGTEAAVRNEAKAVVDLHHVTFAFPVESGTVIRERLVTYADHVRKFEWPAMARGKSSDHVGDDLEELSTAVFQIEPQNLKELAHYQNAVRLLTLIADNRGERIDSANGSVSLLLWFVLIVGYPAFFGASNRLAQTLMTATLAALVALSLLLALALDYPFTRDEKISVLPFEAAL
ncbi:MAG TPA: hypothetical protein VFJ49_12125 [Methyloceanibacter sp.]|nr:hypothetical protein [Methyloceanibacter sp.]